MRDVPYGAERRAERPEGAMKAAFDLAQAWASSVAATRLAFLGTKVSGMVNSYVFFMTAISFLTP